MISMARLITLKFRDLGSIGIAQSPDILSSQLPPEAWTSGRNVLFRGGKVEKAMGMEEWDDSPRGMVKFMFLWREGERPKWIYCVDSMVFEGDGKNSSVVSGRVSSGKWTGGTLNGLPFLNTGDLSRPPLVWNGDLNRFVDMPNWPEGATVRYLFRHRNYLIGLQTQGWDVGVLRPNGFCWSHPADPGQPPRSWDWKDPTMLAGLHTLGGFDDKLVCVAPFGRGVAIYSEKHCWVGELNGNTSVWNFSDPLDVGAIGPYAATIFSGGHFVVGSGDVAIHDGTSRQSIFQNKALRAFYNDLVPELAQKIFLVKFDMRQEIWIFYPSMELGDTFGCSKAMVWNWQYKTVSVRDFPKPVGFAAEGRVSSQVPGANKFLTTDTEDAVGEMFGKKEEEFLLGGDGWFAEGEKGELEFNLPMNSWVERRDLAMDIDPVSQKIVVSGGNAKTLLRAYPQMEGGPVNFFFAARDTLREALNWQGPFYFDPGRDFAVDPIVAGKFISYRVESFGMQTWKLSGIDFDLRVGKY